MVTVNSTPRQVATSDEPGESRPRDHLGRDVESRPREGVLFAADIDLRMVWRSPSHKGTVPIDHCGDKSCAQGVPAGTPFVVPASLADEFLESCGPHPTSAGVSGTSAALGIIPGLRRVARITEYPVTMTVVSTPQEEPQP